MKINPWRSSVDVGGIKCGRIPVNNKLRSMEYGVNFNDPHHTFLPLELKRGSFSGELRIWEMHR